MDFFKDIDDIRNSFRTFARLLPDNGLLVINGDIEKLSSITKGCSCRIITFGANDNNDYTAANIEYNELGYCSYDLYQKETCILHID